jgi:predicted phage terminase large subunit-like protein
VLPIKRNTDKLTRAYDAAPLVEAGKVMLPEQAPWLLDFTAELTTFPNGAHDYQLDAFMDAISCMLYFKASTFNQGMLS